ncbi:MAG: hypothetical protein EOO93_28325 [Pedobacter sp.]|nr:MAG: hypothetical protein EOO93_28325 [Pedobacter sp.]
MEKIITQLQSKYNNEIDRIETIDKSEISIVLNNGVDSAAFSQELQNHLVEIIDELTILQINIVDAKGNVKDRFATNQ